MTSSSFQPPTKPPGVHPVVVADELVPNHRGTVAVLSHVKRDGDWTLPRLFRAFALYLLAECPEGELCPGHTFSASKKSPKYRATWEPCSGYDVDDFFFNPFGRWRLTPAGKKS